MDYLSQNLNNSLIFPFDVLKHIHDGTFYHKSALQIGQKLHEEALLKLDLLNSINNLH